MTRLSKSDVIRDGHRGERSSSVEAYFHGLVKPGCSHAPSSDPCLAIANTFWSVLRDEDGNFVGGWVIGELDGQQGLVAEFVACAAVVTRKHFRRVGESGVNFVYNFGRGRVIFDIAEIDVKFLLRPCVVGAGAAFVVFDPSELMHLPIEIISGVGERKSFDGDSRRVL